MCDYCDCRLQPAIRELGTEHSQLTAVSSQIRQSVAAGEHARARKLFDELLSALDDHSAKEEAGLFAALIAEGELHSAVRRLIADHDDIADLTVGTLSSIEEFKAVVLVVLDHLTEHIFREEHDLYPMSRMALSAAGWSSVEKVHRRWNGPQASTTSV